MLVQVFKLDKNFAIAFRFRCLLQDVYLAIDSWTRVNLLKFKIRIFDAYYEGRYESIIRHPCNITGSSKTGIKLKNNITQH